MLAFAGATYSAVYWSYYLCDKITWKDSDLRLETRDLRLDLKDLILGTWNFLETWLKRLNDNSVGSTLSAAKLFCSRRHLSVVDSSFARLARVSPLHGVQSPRLLGGLQCSTNRKDTPTLLPTSPAYSCLRNALKWLCGCQWIELKWKNVLLHLCFHVVVTCPPPSAPVHGRTSSCVRNAQTRPITARQPFDSSCSFACNNGYTLSGSASRTCLVTGAWDGSDAECAGWFQRVLFFVLHNLKPRYTVCSLKET